MRINVCGRCGYVLCECGAGGKIAAQPPAAPAREVGAQPLIIRSGAVRARLRKDGRGVEIPLEGGGRATIWLETAESASDSSFASPAEHGGVPEGWPKVDREAFERYATNMGHRDFECNEFGDYRNPFTAGPYAFFVAGSEWRRSLAAPQPAPPETAQPYPLTQAEQDALNREERTRAVLEELVALKDLKDHLDRPSIRDLDSGELPAMRRDYERRKPLAWDAARALLKEQGND